MTSEQVYELLRANGALVVGHHRFASGEHGWLKIDCEVIFRQQILLSQVSQALAVSVGEMRVNAVIGPAEGGNYLAEGVAGALSRLRQERVDWIRTEKVLGGFRINACFLSWDRDRCVFVVEDVVNKGGSVQSVIELILSLGGIPIAVACIWNRGEVTAEMLQVAQFESLISEPCESWPAETCPICLEGIVPVGTIGVQGSHFIASRQASSALL